MKKLLKDYVKYEFDEYGDYTIKNKLYNRQEILFICDKLGIKLYRNQKNVISGYINIEYTYKDEVGTLYMYFIHKDGTSKKNINQYRYKLKELGL